MNGDMNGTMEALSETLSSNSSIDLKAKDTKDSLEISNSLDNIKDESNHCQENILNNNSKINDVSNHDYEPIKSSSNSPKNSEKSVDTPSNILHRKSNGNIIETKSLDHNFYDIHQEDSVNNAQEETQPKNKEINESEILDSKNKNNEIYISDIENKAENKESEICIPESKEKNNYLKVLELEIKDKKNEPETTDNKNKVENDEKRICSQENKEKNNYLKILNLEKKKSETSDTENNEINLSEIADLKNNKKDSVPQNSSLENKKMNNVSEISDFGNANDDNESETSGLKNNDYMEPKVSKFENKKKDNESKTSDIKIKEKNIESDISDSKNKDPSSKSESLIQEEKNKTPSNYTELHIEDEENNTSDIVLIEDTPTKQNGKKNDSNTSDIQEINSDNESNDCIITKPESKSTNSKFPVRRSLRSSNKKKKYTEEVVEDESDVELVGTDDLRVLNKPILISNSRPFLNVTPNRRKCNILRKEATKAIMESKSVLAAKEAGLSIQPVKCLTNQVSAQSLCQSIAARGTTITPISSKSSIQPTSSTNVVTPEPILPSLTDDMFVVEAPSFIVPYVYEKPSVKPFREFVDILGKQLEDQKVKADSEKLAKGKVEKEIKQDGNPEKIDEEKENESAVQSEKTVKKENRKRKNEDDDASWDGDTSGSEDDETMSDEDNNTEIIKEKDDDALGKLEDVISGLTVEKLLTGTKNSYFDCSLGKFFINIGLNLVQEFVQTDLLKQQKRKLYREKKSGCSSKATESSITSLIKNLEVSKENNEPYVLPLQKCKLCTFKTESELIMRHHLETPHMRNNLFKCNDCEYEVKNTHDILVHMELVHKKRARLERVPSYHQCANCPYEDNGKGKLARHLIACAKKFKPEMNLSPPIEWEPPAKIPKIGKQKNSMMGFSTNIKGSLVNTPVRPPININNFIGMPNSYRARARPPAPVSPKMPIIQGVTSLVRGNSVLKPSTVTGGAIINNPSKAMKSSSNPSISITPLPRAMPPVQPNLNQKKTFVICEICDGYIKDLDQLRNHMKWIHKVQIHPKMIYNRPPLNCQKCQFRFFTDQGLERHLLGSHGLVTSSMQEAANKGKDAGRCPVCGRVYQWKLLNHVARDHGLTLKPAHLSYKCTVCTATFGMYHLFEDHVYSAHRVVAKRAADRNKLALPKSTEAVLKPVKINDEVTITPQKATSSKGK